MTITERSRPGTRGTLAWAAVIVCLLVVRLPSLVQPAGGDQSLYAYTGQRILAGDVPYRDTWDQKPPGIGFVYAALLSFWPDQSVVPAADLGAAAAVALLLVLLGRLRFSPAVGLGAAAAFLAFGDPYLQRLGGIYVRGQCEPFVSLAIAACLVLLAARARRWWHLVAAGMILGGSFWLKYGAAYGLPVAVAVWVWRRPSDERGVAAFRDLLWVGLGFTLMLGVVLGYFWRHGALVDLRLATIDYNLWYSGGTYERPASIVSYLATFPIRHAMVDPLWFLGGVGSVLILVHARRDPSAWVGLAWLAAAVLAIAMNGSRGLPNYFVQASPALALCATVGLATLWQARRLVQVVVALVLAAGLARVGTDAPVVGMRWASIPGLAANVEYDLRYVRGAVDRESYLARYRGVKHDALEIDRMVTYVRRATAPTDRIFVFGFSGGAICWRSERPSASRFFWSMPVIAGFEAGRPGYGAAGLLDDLRHRQPALVILQKEEWRSRDFFMNDAALRGWLETAYQPDFETPMFAVWKRRP